ncbi:hypothetical protein ARSQ2_01680 [Arsenophonus endosymbiont of Bemisia tabaci Q2]|nr:hypothetical protein ARSQ2_01680 [Arsenophonus endosymbiont of Bemisia tabaci Q2]
MGLTYKKNSTSSESRRKHSTNVSTKKRQYEKEGKHIVFIDESGFSHDTPRTHGYSPKGQRCLGLKNWGAKAKKMLSALYWAQCCLLSIIYHYISDS